MSERETIIALKRDITNNLDVNADYDDGKNVKTLSLHWTDSFSSPSSVGIDDKIWQLQRVEVLRLHNFPFGSIHHQSDDNTQQHIINTIRRMPMLGIGNFSNTLKELTLSNCCNLLALPSEIGLLLNLTSLTIRSCGKIKELPYEIGNLSSLVTLQIILCPGLTCLPPEIGNLTNLQELTLEQNYNLQSIPKEISKLEKFKRLTISGFAHLKPFPSETLKKCRNLLELEWSDMTMIDLPPEIYQIECLQILKIDRCHNLKHFPTGFANLRNRLLKLEISRCNNLEELPKELTSLEKLEELEISLCKKLSRLPLELGDLKTLKTLKVYLCCELQDLPQTIGNLEHLEEFKFDSVDGLKYFPSGSSSLWKRLRKLSITEHYDEIPNIEDIILKCTKFENLHELEIEACGQLLRLPQEIGNWKCLRKWNIDLCENLEGLPPEIGNIESLEKLSIAGCGRLNYLPPEIGKLRNLRHLQVIDSQASVGYLRFLPLEVGNLVNLQVFDICYCGCLERLSFVINKLKGLQQLNIEYDIRFHEENDEHFETTTTAAAATTTTTTTTSSDNVMFNGAFTMTLENLNFQFYTTADSNEFLQRIITFEDQSLHQFSLLLSQKIRSITFKFYESQDNHMDSINQKVLKLLQKYPNLGKISFDEDNNEEQPNYYFTPDLLYMMYFNRFGRSLQQHDGTRNSSIKDNDNYNYNYNYNDNNNDKTTALFFCKEKVLPIILEGIETKIHQEMGSMKGLDCSVEKEMISVSVAYSILRELALSVLLEWEYR